MTTCLEHYIFWKANSLIVSFHNSILTYYIVRDARTTTPTTPQLDYITETDCFGHMRVIQFFGITSFIGNTNDRN